MADFVAPAAPQSFTFGTNQLAGVLVSFSAATKRAGAVHRFLKRRGALVEDMNSEPRTLEVELVFTGTSPAQAYAAFENSINANPTQLLIHPIAGRFQAFCQGPQQQVNLAQALNEIHVRVAFLESELDNQTPLEVPDAATAAQNVTAASSAYQQATAGYLGALAYASTQVAAARATITTLNDQLSALTDPVTSMVTGIVGLPGVATSLIGQLQSVQVLNSILAQQISDYVDSAGDLFTGAVVSPAASAGVVNLLGVVVNTAQSLEGLLVSMGTPASGAESVGTIEEMLALCYVLADAVQTLRPTVVQVTLPRLTDLVSWCQARYPGNAQQRASDIRSLNLILNPAAIPAGTVLTVPVS